MSESLAITDWLDVAYPDLLAIFSLIFAGHLPLLAADDPLVAYAVRGVTAFGESIAALELKLSS